MKLRAMDPLLYEPGEDLLFADKQFLDHFYELVTKNIHPPFAISIDGAWGSGKTTVMRILKSRLEGKSYPVFWFNPWEYQQTGSVVMAFLQCLAGRYKNVLKTMKIDTGNIFKFLLECGIEAGLKTIGNGIFSLPDIKEKFQEIKKGSTPSYEDYENTIETIKSEFVQLIRQISEKHKNNPVMIFFDDLDRCLPDEAIQLLEALKNLFVTPESRCIFICGLDTHVTKQFIREHYRGLEADFSINYFRKIFNLTISIPYTANFESLMARYIGELFNQKGNLPALAQTIFAMGKEARIGSARKYLNIVNNIFVFSKFNPDYRFNPEKKDLIMFLLILKEAMQPLFEDLIQTAIVFPDRTLNHLYNAIENKYVTVISSNLDHFVKTYIDQTYFGEIKLFDLLKRYPTLA